VNDNELTELLTQISPITDTRVATLADPDLDTELCEKIMAVPALETVIASPSKRRHWQRRFLSGAAVVTAAALVAVVLNIQPSGHKESTAWASEAIAVAESAPRYLLGPDWKVDYVDEFSQGEGEIHFTNSKKQSFEIFWLPANTHEDYFEDRAVDAGSQSPIRLANNNATLFRTDLRDLPDYDNLISGSNVKIETNNPSPPYVVYSVMWLEGDHSLEIRTGFNTDSEFKTVLAELQEVDVDTWLSAMPPNVVKAGGRASAVKEILADIPVPKGFDTAMFDSGGLVLERYHLGAEITGKVTCAWIDQWFAAKKTKDQKKIEEAVAAMRTVPDWAILHEMDKSGEWSPVVRDYARRVVEDGLQEYDDGSIAWTETGEDGTVIHKSEKSGYRQGLGCADPQE